MKKYFQSTVYIIFVIVTFIALAKSFMVYENPFDLYENPLVWLALIGLILVVALKEIVNIIAVTKVRQFQNEKEGIVPEAADAWIQKLIKSWTKVKPIEQEQEIILDHNYDGIRELDNSLPPWWVYMFYITIFFAVFYLAKYEIFDGDSNTIEYEKEVASLKKEPYVNV